MNRPLRYAITAILATAGLTVANRIATANDAELALSWRLIGNRPKGDYRAELTLRNDRSGPMTDDWKLYFNSVSRLLSESVSADYALTHINGDFYVLAPNAGSKPIQRGESRRIAWDGAPWAINISDAPSGFYLVRTDQNGSSQPPIQLPLRIEPFPEPSELRRGAADVVPVVTAESRYLENESLSMLPPDKLVRVVPTPVDTKPLLGQFRLGNSTTIVHEPQLAGEAKYLANALEQLLEQKIAIECGIPTARPSPDTIKLRVDEIDVGGSAKRQGDEAYLLTINPDDGVEIIGSDPAGVFYGLQTLRALLPISSYRKPTTELAIDAMQIADAPRFHYRGLHLDVARNFQTKESVEKLLDLMALYKLNRFHWHLTDDEGWRIEINQLPELTDIGGRRCHSLNEDKCLIPSHGSGPSPDADTSAGSGFYSQEDFVEVLRYAHARHIIVIPEIDLPGHSRAAVKAMEARHRRFSQNGDRLAADATLLSEPGDPSKYESVQLWRDNVVDVGREATYRFLTVVFDELVAMYQRSGAPLINIHLGGDEVPVGAWEQSTACERIPNDVNSKIPRRGQLELYFLNRASGMLVKRSIQPACWEDCLILETDQDSAVGSHWRAAGKPTPIAYVWNNVWGWGREDAAYRLANAGFDVVLCNATHLYFDLASEKDPSEPGYYWAGFVGMRAPFEFVPLDAFKNAGRDAMGQAIGVDSFAGRTRLTSDGARHILGIQGQLWGENLRDARSLEYMAFPRVIALAERAWGSSPEWAESAEPAARRSELDRDWNQFANRLGQRELERLDYLHGGVQYRLPPPGATVRDLLILANVAFPGLTIRYTIDGSEPNSSSEVYREPISLVREVRLKSFDTRGRGSRTVVVIPGREE